MRRITGLGAVALLLGTVAPALLTTAATPTAAASTPSDTAGLVYPVTSFMDWAESPVDDFTNPTLGQDAFDQEVENAQASIARLPQQLDISALLGPNGPADAEAISEEMATQLVRFRPRVAGDDVTDQANPDFLPDFDHNGTYGDPGDFAAMSAGGATGYFLYPCLSDSGAVTYQTTSGNCLPAGTPGHAYKEGLAQQVSIVSSRGMTLAATLWLPAAALRHGCPTPTDNPAPCAAPAGLAPRSALGGGRGLPAVVISDGIASDQDSYYWLSMALARAGDVVVTYDPAGQGASDGSAADLFTPSAPNCEFGGACRDLQDVVRWLVGDPISLDVSPSATTHNPADEPHGANIVDPALGAIDTKDLAIVGHSMGALSLLNYLWYQSRGTTGIDGRPLPPIAAAVALSGAATTAAAVPIQFQTSDYDGSPTLVGPAVAGVDLGTSGNGIGYADMKPLYDQLRTKGPGRDALSMVVLEGGVHTDFIDTPFITRTPWSLATSAHYATNWLGCFLDHDFGNCLEAISPAPHLSSSFASEASPPGAPPRPSRCITVPTTASLDDPPSQFLSAEEGHPVTSCSR